MRFARLLRLGSLALVGWAAACSHDDPLTVVTRGGSSTITAIDMVNAGAGFPGGTRVTNRFLATVFDTAVADAFARATANPAAFRTEPPNGPCYGSTPLIYEPNTAAAVPTYTPPNRMLPALVTPVVIQDGGCGTATAYIVPGGHPGNGAGNTFWEFWHDFAGVASTRYISGLVRYAVQQRGALDVAEVLQTGAVAQPDTLVFRAGDFNPAGRKARDAFVSCASASVVQPVAGANPMLLGSDTTRSGIVDIDQTACDTNGVWFNGVGNAKSPVSANNNTMSTSQYNFFVIWVALPDSTPDYTKPVYREQIGPLLSPAGTVINNSYAPFPPAALSAAQLALLPAAAARADSMKVTATSLVPLATGAYQLWLVQSGTNTAQLVTGRVVRLHGATVVDTLNGVSEFNVTGTIDAARIEFDFGPYAAVSYDAVTLAIAPTTGATSLSTSQPLWTPVVTQKPKLAPVPPLTSTLSFGSFNSGTGSVLFGAAGSGSGGLFGPELREVIRRLLRPPMGYTYDAWLLNSTDTTKKLDIGPLTGVPPSNISLVDADTMTTEPLSGGEITVAGFRYVAPSPATFCDYDLVEVVLKPKAMVGGKLAPTVVLKGTNSRVGC